MRLAWQSGGEPLSEACALPGDAHDGTLIFSNPHSWTNSFIHHWAMYRPKKKLKNFLAEKSQYTKTRQTFLYQNLASKHCKKKNSITALSATIMVTEKSSRRRGMELNFDASGSSVITKHEVVDVMDADVRNGLDRPLRFFFLLISLRRRGIHMNRGGGAGAFAAVLVWMDVNDQMSNNKWMKGEQTNYKLSASINVAGESGYRRWWRRRWGEGWRRSWSRGRRGGRARGRPWRATARPAPSTWWGSR